MSTFNIIVSLLIADILSVSVFVLLDWKPTDVWDRVKALTRNVVEAIISILESISVSNNHNGRNVERTSPAIIVIDQRGAFRQLTPKEVRELYASIRYSDDAITDSSIYDTADMGQGYTSEDLFNAVSVVMGTSAQMQDRKTTGEVLSHFDGAEMFDQMCREHKDFSERFQSLVKEYRNTKQ